MSDEIIDMSSGSDSSGLVINELIKAELNKTTKWTTFLAVLGFIGLGFVVIAGFFMIGVNSRAFMGDQALIIGLVYLLMGALYFFPIYYLYKFSVKCKEALGFGGQMALNEAFIYMRKQYQFVGIVTIVVMSIYFLIIIAAILFAGRVF